MRAREGILHNDNLQFIVTLAMFNTPFLYFSMIFNCGTHTCLIIL